MAQTFSQGITGVNANGRFAVKTVSVGDADNAGDALNNVTVRSKDQTMTRGNQILCKNPDGSQSWYTIDSTRPVTGGQLTLLPVGP